MGILEDILARLERIESAVSADQKAPAPEPVQTQAPAPQPAIPAPAPAGGLYGPQTATSASGPQPVPTLPELNDMMLTLQEQKGVDVCLSLIRQYQGTDPQGNASLSLVPAEQYAALQQAIRQQMEVH